MPNPDSQHDPMRVDETDVFPEPVDCDLVPDIWRQLANETVMFPMKMDDVALKIGPERQLFVDNLLIASTANLTKQVHQPRPHQDHPVLAACDEDPRVQVLHVMQFDESPRFRMWYWSGDDWHAWGENEEIRWATSYAVSEDGIEWSRPDLDLHRIDGWPEKNIVMPYGFMHGLFYEPWESDPQKRFKALVCVERRDRKTMHRSAPRAYYLHTSPDGIHWQGNLSRGVIPQSHRYRYPANGIGDTTRFWWDTYRKKYMGDVKWVLPGKLRCRGMMESDDLIHWTRPHPTLFAKAQDSQIYGHRGYPYQGMYIGLRWLYRPGLDIHRCNHAMDVELDCSRDAQIWTRVCSGQKFMPFRGTWDGWSAKPSAMLEVGDEIWIYYTAKGGPEYRKHHDTHHGWSAGLVKLRRDGFVSLNAAIHQGHLVTRPLGFSGSRLHVNAEIQAGGFLRVGLRGLDNQQAIGGYAVADAVPMSKSSINHLVTWQDGADIRPQPDADIRLEFQMENAKLYAFWID